MPRPLPEPLVELIAQRFRVIGEPMRIKLLDRLRDGSATVGAPWFLLLTAFVGVNQWLFVVAGACPVSLVLTRVFGLRSTTKEVA